MNRVTMSVESALVVALMGILKDAVMTSVKKDILAKTVPRFAHLTVNLLHVDTRTAGVLPVRQVGPVITVPLNAFCPMETIVIIHAMHTVSTRRATESTGAVCMAVKMVTSVIKFL